MQAYMYNTDKSNTMPSAYRCLTLAPDKSSYIIVSSMIPSVSLDTAPIP
jgi:hypothetical protein